jgi:hypothetical protein
MYRLVAIQVWRGWLLLLALHYSLWCVLRCVLVTVIRLRVRGSRKVHGHFRVPIVLSWFDLWWRQEGRFIVIVSCSSQRGRGFSRRNIMLLLLLLLMMLLLRLLLLMLLLLLLLLLGLLCIELGACFTRVGYAVLRRVGMLPRTPLRVTNGSRIIILRLIVLWH